MKNAWIAVRKAVLVLLMAAEGFWVFMWVINVPISLTSSGSVPISYSAGFLLLGIWMIVISANQYARVGKGEKSPLITGFFMKVYAVLLVLNILFLMDGNIGAGIVFSIFNVIIAILIIFFRKKRRNSVSAADNRPLPPVRNYAPSADNRAIQSVRNYSPAQQDKKSVNDIALMQYCERFDKNKDQPGGLTYDDNMRISVYTATPAAYFAAWLLKNGFFNESFLQNPDVKAAAQQVTGEQLSPVSFLEKFSRSELREGDLRYEIIRFVRYYYSAGDMRSFSIYNRPYYFDYYEFAALSGGYYYCSDFTWEAYHRLEKRINEVYKEYMETASFDPSLSDVETVGDYKWGLFDCLMPVRVMNHADESDMESCENILSAMNVDGCRALCKRIISSYKDDFESDADEYSEVMKHCAFDEMIVFKRNEGHSAFIICGELDFDEHGIAITFIDNQIISIYQRMDISPPFSAENIMKYKLAMSAADAHTDEIKDQNDLDKAISSGRVESVRVIGENGEEADTYVCPYAADIVRRSLIMSRCLISKGAKNVRHECKAEFSDKKLIPDALRLAIYADDRNLPVYFECLELS